MANPGSYNLFLRATFGIEPGSDRSEKVTDFLDGHVVRSA